MEVIRLDWSDWTVFILMLLFSILIGIYFGCFGSKQSNPEEYFLGGRKLKPWPVGISLVASTISGLTLIGVPTEVYTDSAAFWLINFAQLFSAIVAYKFIIPMYFEMEISSVFEYLERRFDKTVKNFASVLYCCSFLLFMPSAIYLPSLTLNQVTGVNIHIISTSATVICVFYTTLGGLKGVVWTDFIQLIVALLACIAIVIIGTIDSDGIGKVFKIATEENKLNLFNFNPNPFQRTTFWTIFIGAFINGVCLTSFNQVCIQRFVSLSSPKDIKLVLIINWLGVFLLNSFCVYGGLLLYASYYACDPLDQNIISQADQIFPYYIVDKIGYVPTLPGLFVAGVFSAGLSTLSTGLNTIPATIYEDYIKTRVKNKNKVNFLIKLTTIFIGVFSIAMGYLISKMGKILSVVTVIMSITTVPIGVIFVTGMLFPFCNKKGVLTGAIGSVILILWLAIGSTIYKVNFVNNKIYRDEISTCLNSTITVSTAMTKVEEKQDVFFLYQLSYMLYGTFGLSVGVVISLVMSYITGLVDPATIDPILICSPLRKLYFKNKTNDEQNSLRMNEFRDNLS